MSTKPEKEKCTGLFYEDPRHNTWIAIQPKENDKYRVILPKRKSPMTIHDIEDLLNWINKVFPNSIDIIKVEESYTEV